MPTTVLIRRILLVVCGCAFLLISALLWAAQGDAASAAKVHSNVIHVKATVDTEAEARRLAASLAPDKSQVLISDKMGIRRIPDKGWVLLVKGMQDYKPVSNTLARYNFDSQVEEQSDGSKQLRIGDVFPDKASALRTSNAVTRSMPIRPLLAQHTVKVQKKMWVIEYRVPDQTAAETLRADLKKAKVLQVQ